MPGDERQDISFTQQSGLSFPRDVFSVLHHNSIETIWFSLVIHGRKRKPCHLPCFIGLLTGVREEKIGFEEGKKKVTAKKNKR